MRGISCILVVALCVGSALSALIGNTTMEDDAWWGPNDYDGTEDTSIRPFTIEFTDEMIEDLRSRLLNHRPFVPPLENTGFTYGFNSNEMPKWIDYWANEYPFAERVEFINKYPQFQTSIQGLNIHFVHIVPEVPEGVDIVPLMLLHGFPGTYLEFYDAIPHLAAVSEDRDYALELIIPSLPGFPYSDSATIPGLGATEMGVVLRNLMKRLGHDYYYIQGGDWGEYVASSIATLFPEEVLGHHTNYARSLHPQTLMSWYLGSDFTDLVVDRSTADRMYPISKVLKFYAQEFGYFHLHASKPDTIGIVLSDSPSALLAYCLQLISFITRASNTYTEDGGIEDHYTKAQLFDFLTLFWSTNTINTACRIYAETTNLRTQALGVGSIPSPVLTWTIHAPDELIYQSPFLLKFKYPNLVHSTIIDEGGHLLAMELPEIFSEDVFKAMTTFRSMHAENETICSVLPDWL